MTDLPDPDSPTMATVSPLPISRSTLRTALVSTPILKEGHGQIPNSQEGVHHLNVFLGSKASRTPSKMKTRSESMIAKVMKAVKPSQGA